MPAVSVILPNFNHAKFLNQRIDTILNQSFTNFELLIFDDASTDDSKDIINSYTDKRISHVEVSTKNSGSPFNYWKKGIALSKSPLIWIAESDDYADPSFLETMHSNFANDPELSISFAASHWVNSAGEIIHSPGHEIEPEYLAYKKALETYFLKGSFIYNASSALFKKSALDNFDFDTLKSFKYAGDWYFWSNFNIKGNLIRSAQRLNYFRRHENNVSFKAEKEGLHIKEGLQIVGILLKKLKIPWITKQRVLAYWALKLHEGFVSNKKKYLAYLPSEVKLWYLVSPMISKFLKWYRKA